MSTTWREQLAWAAGFYDGEGCMSLTTATSYKVSIVQVDPAVLLKFQAAVLGLGTLQGPYKTASMGENHKPRWQFVATGASAQAVVAMLWEFLGDVKKEQALKCLHAGGFRPPVWRGGADEDPRVCGRGHRFAGNRTKAGQCRPCMRLADARRAPARAAARKALRETVPSKKRGRPPNPAP